jgi:hypothetical protein
MENMGIFSTQNEGQTVAHAAEGIPDLRWINRHLSIGDVARELKLQHWDRTPSVAICRKNNTIHCFGCGTKPMSVVDLVMDKRGITIAEAGRWALYHGHYQRFSCVAPT